MKLDASILGNPIAAALEFATPTCDSCSPDQVIDKITVLAANRVRLGLLRDDMLEVEEHSKEVVETRIKALSEEIQQLKASIMPDVRSFKIFDLTPLTWRDDAGLPLLAVFTTDSPLCIIKIGYDNWDARETFSMKPKLSNKVKDCYRDVAQARKVRREMQHGDDVKLTTQFNGVIPDHVRDLIKQSEPIFKETFLVAEANGWAFERVKPRPPRNLDPLVIGFDGKQYRLITSFDLTPIEKLVKDRIDGVLKS